MNPEPSKVFLKRFMKITSQKHSQHTTSDTKLDGCHKEFNY
jgi:hypothetical protein